MPPVYATPASQQTSAVETIEDSRSKLKILTCQSRASLTLSKALLKKQVLEQGLRPVQRGLCNLGSVLCKQDPSFFPPYTKYRYITDSSHV